MQQVANGRMDSDHQEEDFTVAEAVEKVHLQEVGGEAEEAIPKQE
jgi:hypothetical protein